MSAFKLHLGANITPNRKIEFKFWGPNVNKASVVLDSRTVQMSKDKEDYFTANAKVSSNARYLYRIDNSIELPDPASRFQPDGIRGPSQIIDPKDFTWTDQDWHGISLEDLIIYELPVSTFTPEGNFEGVMGKLPHIEDVGFTCVEPMPLAQFPGKRGWGYDGIFPFAPQNSYGGPVRLKSLINSLHGRKIAAAKDLVCNHTGAGGDNFLDPFGPYLTEKYTTPWGKTFNYDGEGSQAVRDFIISNALYWIFEYHFDVLRLDAVDYIFDSSQKHILREIRDEVKRLAKSLGRNVLIIGESSENDPKFIQPPEEGGYGLDAVWSFNPEQALRRKLTGETASYYGDFTGNISDIAKGLEDPNIFNGTRESAFRKRKKPHGKPINYGKPSSGTSTSHFVVYHSSHDSIGNSPSGSRLSTLVSFEEYKLSSALALLSPYIPMVFSGDEFGSSSPFLFFVNYDDQLFRDGARSGRLGEMQYFERADWESTPDPNDPKSFLDSRINWDELDNERNQQIKSLYKDLIEFRKRHFGKAAFKRENITVNCSKDKEWVAIEYDLGNKKIGVIHSFSDQAHLIGFPFCGSSFESEINTADKKYGGSQKTENSSRFEIMLEPKSSMAGWIH
ncbi:MAG: malto-oligosyltrehalose trehalohydrolase [Candidatus Melainabacteria bacterium RIFCSPHIGHO2_02_FULL_34_12]|nr:MAG: malto-oligosyltrehalose trehalohydrolase [Candidatus Melainabacteria bacterium RIFCSPHIGHO2_02_FULL_34_12]